jgi:hypothetical protein
LLPLLSSLLEKFGTKEMQKFFETSMCHQRFFLGQTVGFPTVYFLFINKTEKFEHITKVA